MNLVQINERLKDLPMQVVQQYANGMNPEVPPYLALGELQRREMAQKQMATAQGAAQGPQPSIKEQVEQKAGLMQLQQMQQQQMAQQQAQPQGPMPVPAGAPQPQMQPQAQQAMMARGGLAGVPVRRDMFEYAGGGIIAFQSGGQSLNERAARQMEQKGSIYDPYFGVPEEERRRLKEEDDLKKAQAFASGSLSLIQSNAKAMADSAQARVTELEQNREELTRKFGPRMYEQALGKAQQAVEAASARGSELVDRQTQTGQARVAAATPPPAAPFGSKFAPANPADMVGSSAGLPAALAKAAPAAAAQPSAVPRPGAPRPTATPPATPAGLPDALPPAMQTGAPARAAIPVSPDRAELEALMKSQERKEPTAQGIIGDVNALLPAGLQEEARQRMIADQRARAAERKATFEKTRPSGLDDIIRVFGQSGQYKGGTGFAPAYTANQDRRRAEELAFQKEQDELLTAIDARSTAGDEKLFTARTGAMDKAQTLFGQSQKSILDAAAKKLEASQGRLDAESKLNMQRDLKMFEMAQEERLKRMDLTQRERERATTAANNPAAQAAQYVALMQQSRDLREKGKPAEADKLAAQAADMLAFKGGSGAAAGERNDISAVKAEQAGLLKELENVTLPKDVRQRKQQQLDATYKKLNDLYGGTGTTAPQDGKVPPPPPGFKVN